MLSHVGHRYFYIRLELQSSSDQMKLTGQIRVLVLQEVFLTVSHQVVREIVVESLSKFEKAETWTIRVSMQ